MLSATDRAPLAVAGLRGRRLNADVPVGGTVPQVLGLTLSSAERQLRRLRPGRHEGLHGVAHRDGHHERAQRRAERVATRAPTATGHLVNGTYVLPQALQVKAGTGAFAPVGGASAPRRC